ncbi:GtrA family protein [Amnibacterium sp.]|uniref:GtrA family protein n=1 Tax=Amnibacterium sp. TaxID=1872496 RepID=UPI003F7C43C3
MRDISPTAARGRTLPDLVRVAWSGGLKAAMSFGVVGLGGMVIDVGVFNALRLGLFGHGALIDKPLTASVVSASLAIVFNWVGNRFWTFRGQRRPDVWREALEYGAVALLGLGVSLLSLAVSHYALGLHSIAADNVAKNVIGLGLGTILRFSLSRWWIWRPSRRAVAAGIAGRAAAPALGTDA